MCVCVVAHKHIEVYNAGKNKKKKKYPAVDCQDNVPVSFDGCMLI